MNEYNMEGWFLLILSSQATIQNQLEPSMFMSFGSIALVILACLSWYGGWKQDKRQKELAIVLDKQADDIIAKILKGRDDE